MAQSSRPFYAPDALAGYGRLQGLFSRSQPSLPRRIHHWRHKSVGRRPSSADAKRIPPWTSQKKKKKGDWYLTSKPSHEPRGQHPERNLRAAATTPRMAAEKWSRRQL